MGVKNYMEGARSLFDLFSDREPQRLVLPKRKPLTLSQAMAKDANAMRGDVQRALGKAILEVR
jgi:hypothetical protein